MKFSDLKLKAKDAIKIINPIKGVEIKVKQYLPMEEKVNLVQIALQQSIEDGVYNEGLLIAYFNTYIVMFYSDLEFSDEEKQDIISIFDILDTNGIITAVCDAIPETEFHDLTDLLNSQHDNNIVYKQSAAYLIGQFINVLPQQMEKVSEIINDFDPSKYQAVVDFATAANGGRNINTNQPVE